MSVKEKIDKKENKKELIRDAAIRVISREGFFNTKTASIAEEADVAVGTIYNYFENKQEILEYIFEVEFEKRMDYLKEVKKNKGSIFKKIKLFLNRHFAEIKNNPELGKILVREKEFTKKGETASISQYLNRLPAAIEEMLNQAVKDGQLISDIDSRIISAAIFGAIQGIVEKAVGEEKFDLLDSAAEEIVELLKRGLEG